MRKFIVIVLTLSIASLVFAEGVEKGDTEVGASAFYYTLTGVDFDMAYGYINASIGKYITDKLLLGIAPGLSIFTVLDKTETDFSGSLFGNYNLSVASKSIPYAKASYYQMTFDIPEGSDFLDFGYMQIGFGVKNFFTENLALDTSVNYGFSLAAEAEGGILLLQSGLTFIF